MTNRRARPSSTPSARSGRGTQNANEAARAGLVIVEGQPARPARRSGPRHRGRDGTGGGRRTPPVARRASYQSAMTMTHRRLPARLRGGGRPRTHGAGPSVLFRAACISRCRRGRRRWPWPALVDRRVVDLDLLGHFGLPEGPRLCRRLHRDVVHEWQTRQFAWAASKPPRACRASGARSSAVGSAPRRISARRAPRRSRGQAAAARARVMRVIVVTPSGRAHTRVVSTTLRRYPAGSQRGSIGWLAPSLAVARTRIACVPGDKSSVEGPGPEGVGAEILPEPRLRPGLAVVGRDRHRLDPGAAVEGDAAQGRAPRPSPAPRRSGWSGKERTVKRLIGTVLSAALRARCRRNRCRGCDRPSASEAVEGFVEHADALQVLDPVGA